MTTTSDLSRPPERRDGLFAISWPFLPIGLAASLTVSPIATVDSRVLMAAYLNDFVIPHFPPLYPLFTRIVAKLPEILAWQVADVGGTLREPDFSAIDIKLILAVQHALTIVGAAYLAERLPLGLWGKRAVVALLYLNPITLHATHALLSEALVTPALFASFAEAVSLVVHRERSRRRLALFCLWISAATLARHIAILLGLLLPLGYAIQALSALVRDRREFRPALGRAAVSVVALGLVFIVTQQAANLTMRTFDVEPRSILGRAFVYRITPAALQAGAPVAAIFVAPDEFRQMLQRLQATAPDEDVAETLRIVERSAFTWVEPFNKVLNYLESKKCPGCPPLSHPWAQADKLLNRASLHAILSPNLTLWEDATLRTLFTLAPGLFPRGLTGWPGRLWTPFDLASVPPAKGYDTAALQSTFLWRAGTDLGVVITVARQSRELIVPIAFGIATLFLLRAKSVGALIFATLGVVFATAAAMSILTVYVVRYGILLDQLAILAAVVAGGYATGAVEASERSDAASDQIREAATPSRPVAGGGGPSPGLRPASR